MSAPAWFDEKTYFNNKLLLEQAKDPSLTSQQLADALRAAGFPTDSDGLYEHFVQFGNAEGVSPNGYFDVDTYLANKAALENTTVDAVKQALDSLGLSAWDHYTLAGAAEGLNPSAGFDTNAYLQAKVELEKPNNPDLTVADVEKAMADLGINPLEHFLLYGLAEGVNYTPGQYPAVPDIPGEGDDDNPGETYDLTTGWDKLTGTAGDDTFNAEIGALQAQDKIDGGDGNDTLHAYLGVQEIGYAINPTINNVENVLFTVQGSANDGGGDNITHASIDFDRVNLADGQTLSLGSVNSRGHLSIEDVRHDSNESVVVFQDADPEVGLEVYFDNKHITANDSVTTGNLYLQLIDTVGAAEAAAAGTDEEHGALRDNPYTGFQFTLNGKSYTVNFGTYNSTSDETPTYQELADLIQKAIDADATLSKLGITVSLGGEFDAVVGIGSHAGETVTGTQIVLTTEQGELGQGNWIAANGLPSTNSTSATMENPSSTDCPLTSTTVHLSGAGRVVFDDNASCLPNLMQGSSAGDVVIGSMADINGVERFDVKVDEDSWISGMRSTNNALRMVTVAGTDIDGDGMAENGDLYIGDWNGREDLKGSTGSNMTWTDAASLLENGLTDVAVFDASGYEGNINLGASITSDSYDKYLKQVDGNEAGLGNPPLDGYNGAFTYNMGNGNDVVNMTVNGAVAADNDFEMAINSGSGDDLVAFRFEDMEANQSLNQKTLKNVSIDAGEGNDTVWFYGKHYEPGNTGVETHEGGSAVINGGAGNDVIYVNQEDKLSYQEALGPNNLSAQAANAVFVFNTNATEVSLAGREGATLSNNLAVGASSLGLTGLKTGDVVKVTVDFLGFTASVDVPITNMNVTSGNGSVSTYSINQAIIKAIANDPELSALLSARDGAGNSLIVESKINGVYGTDDLSISLQLFNGDTPATGGAIAVGDWYDTKYGTLGSDSLTGTNSTTSQAIVDGGAGDDIIVLGHNGKMDVVNVSAGTDTLVGFVSGEDKLNLYNLGVLDASKKLETGIVNNGVGIATGTPAAVDGVFTQAELDKIVSQYTLAANEKAVLLIQNSATGDYIVMALTGGTKVSGAILGTLKLDDDHGTLSVGDFILQNPDNIVLQDPTAPSIKPVDPSTGGKGDAFNNTFNVTETGTGNAVVSGLGGDDTFNVDASTTAISNYTFDGGTGADTVNIAGATGTSLTVKDVEKIVLDKTTTGADSLTIGQTSGLTIEGLGASDTLTIDSDKDVTINGLDVVEGTITVNHVGNLTIKGFADTVTGNLAINASAATGVVNIDTTGLDKATGFTLTGAKGDDTFLVTGGKSNAGNTITGGAGDDTITLENTRVKDTITFEAAKDNGVDTITGFEGGATDGDVLDFTTTGVTLSGGALQSGKAGALTLSATDSIGVLTGVAGDFSADTLKGLIGADSNGITVAKDASADVIVLTTTTDGKGEATYNIYFVDVNASGKADSVTLMGTVEADAQLDSVNFA